ncbi:Bacterial alpha-L-rhamnosidase [Carboxylicivirga sp. M1479]|nr:Bacterial alpha-L-rhamnosidase [Carboxylicivirga sp. M1479]
MKQFTLTLIVILSLSACQQHSQKSLYQADNYTIYTDKVSQGEYTAQVLSPTHITSDYQSPANATFPNFIEFKFAINGKDNELPIGVNHTFLLEVNNKGSIEVPTLFFGKKHNSETKQAATGSIEPNTPISIRVDASNIIKALKEQGYYQTYQGDKIYQEDFKGIYIAGNLAPLSWDFDNLPGRTDRQLTDDNNDGIFEISFELNPYNEDDFTAKEWKLENDISNYSQIQSDVPLIDALYNMALDETEMNIEDDGTFRTGEEWPGVWTRDVSYSIVLAYAFTNPEVAKTSLMQKVKNERIIQDTGTGGAWPISSDRTTWALAAWEVYKVTGDEQWLKTIYPIIKNSVLDDMQTLKDHRSGLIKGESSFLDWRKQTYPDWMDGVDIFESRCLGTNAVHAQTYHLLGQMAQLLGDDGQDFQQEAEKIRKAINNELWMDDKGYYAQYLYGRNKLILSPRSEALGEAFTVLFNIANEQQAERVIENTPVVDYGVPCIYPQIPEIPPYHNNGIWPFVQAYWNWACAKTGNTSAVEQGLAGMNRAAALFLTNKENMVADNGDFRDTEVNSNRQLWSVAGYMSTIYRVFAGMNFELDGLHFHPHIPSSYGKQLAISNIKYREATLDITIKGHGSIIKSCTINNKEGKAFIPHNAQGHHQIVIELQESKQVQAVKHSQDNQFSLVTPRLQRNRNKLMWNEVEGATAYQVLQDGKLIASINNNEFVTEPSSVYHEYSIKAINPSNESFSSQIEAIHPSSSITVDATLMSKLSDNTTSGYSGKGYLVLDKKQNTNIQYSIKVDKAGTYLIQARYSNGSGPNNTDNKCAIRTLKVNGSKVGVLVMPQRGKDEWSNWGLTNLVTINLKKGNNTIQLSFEDYNNNMNGEVNRALIDEIKLIPSNK